MEDIMNFYLKPGIMIVAILFISCTAWSSESGVKVSAEKNDQCKDATYGRLDYGNIEFKDPGHNAFLLNCSLSAVVPEPDEKRETYDKYMKDKQKLASLLLVKNLDVDYRDSHGSTLLMSVIVSYLPDEWKEKAAMTLIQKGCDVNAVNNYGRTAIDLARFKKNEKIIKMLSNLKK
jgi:hypothetical protein